MMLQFLLIGTGLTFQDIPDREIIRLAIPVTIGSIRLSTARTSRSTSVQVTFARGRDLLTIDQATRSRRMPDGARMLQAASNRVLIYHNDSNGKGLVKVIETDTRRSHSANLTVSALNGERLLAVYFGSLGPTCISTVSKSIDSRKEWSTAGFKTIGNEDRFVAVKSLVGNLQFGVGFAQGKAFGVDEPNVATWGFSRVE